MTRNLMASTARGAAGFGAGGAVGYALTYVSLGRGGSAGPGALALPLLVAGLFLSGAIGAVALTWGGCERRDVVRAALGFGGGFVLAGFGALFVSISMQGGGRPEVGWGTVGFGIAFGLGGAIGALLLSPRLALYGAGAFGFAGAWGGWLLFTNAARKGPFVGAIAVVAIMAPYVLGGALFGAAAGLAAED